MEFLASELGFGTWEQALDLDCDFCATSILEGLFRDPLGKKQNAKVFSLIQKSYLTTGCFGTTFLGQTVFAVVGIKVLLEVAKSFSTLLARHLNFCFELFENF